MKYTIIVVIALVLTLSGCGKEGEEVEREPEPVAAIPVTDIAYPSAPFGTVLGHALITRPATVSAAINGLSAAIALLAPVDDDDELAFALLQELAQLLHVDIVDALNQSSNRAQTLDQYVTLLSNTTDRGKMKLRELEREDDELSGRLSEQRSTVRDIKRELSDALREKDYAAAGTVQRRLLAAENAVATTGLEKDRLGSIVRHYKDLLKIAIERLDAIENNRELFVSGLRIIDLPGLEDTGVIEEGQRRRARDLFDI